MIIMTLVLRSVCCMCPGVATVAASKLHTMGVHRSSLERGELACYVCVVSSPS